MPLTLTKDFQRSKKPWGDSPSSDPQKSTEFALVLNRILIMIQLYKLRVYHSQYNMHGLVANFLTKICIFTKK